MTAVDALALTAAMKAGRRPGLTMAITTRRVTAVTRQPPFRRKTVLVEVSRDLNSGFFAKCLKEKIVAHSANWEALLAEIRSAVSAASLGKHPYRVQLHIVRAETLLLQ